MTKILFPEIDWSAIKAVLIDLDNTLYLYEPCHEHALKCCFENFFSAKMSFAEFAALYKSYRDKITESLNKQGSCRSRLFAFQNLLEDLHEKDSYVKATILDEIYWSNFIEVMKLEDDAKSLLKTCEEKFLPICVVTDMLAITQVRKLQKLQIVDHIKFLVTSEEAGVEKPSEVIFNLALKKLNLKPKEVIMIGDDEKKDVIGAAKIGIRSYQVKIS